MKSVKISVIIPCYGVEMFIEKCSDSLMRQTLTDIEWIFVNDFCMDNSMSVLESVLSRYPEHRKQIRVIHHDKNRGLPAARNTGLYIAQGEYVFHCDGDDWVHPTMLEALYIQAVKTNADIVWCDYLESYKEHDFYKKEPKYNETCLAVKAMLSGTMKYNVWNKLVRRKLYIDNNITFPEGRAMGEDLTMIKLFSVANKISYLPKAFYHYVRWNTTAMTQTWNEDKIADLRANVKGLEDFLQLHNPNQYDVDLDYLKLWLKFQFLLSDGSHGMYKQWNNWYPNSNKSIDTLPNANGRLKLLMKMASRQQWWFVWLHYWIVYRGYYFFRYRN